MKPKVPEGVIERLPNYLNCLLQFERQGFTTVSSKRMGEVTGVNPAEIRRDLIYFGTFGIKGVGYEVKYLINKIQKILGSDKPHQIALVGAGNLGSAIAGYDGLKKHGFFVSAVFDQDPKKIGTLVGGVKVSSVADMSAVLKERKIDMAILAVPPVVAQMTADKLVAAGVNVILNYTSIMIETPNHVQIHNSDPVNELLYTLYYLSTRKS